MRPGEYLHKQCKLDPTDPIYLVILREVAPLFCRESSQAISSRASSEGSWVKPLEAPPVYNFGDRLLRAGPRRVDYGGLCPEDGWGEARL